MGASGKRFGGVRVTFRKVDDNLSNSDFRISRRGELPWPPGDCPCGKTFQQCGDAWDRELGITSRSADSYKENLEKVRRAEIEGRDPYHKRLREGPPREWGWRPYMPPGSFVVPTASPDLSSTTSPAVSSAKGAKHGKKKRSAGNRPTRGGSGTARGSGRRGRGKSVRRKR